MGDEIRVPIGSDSDLVPARAEGRALATQLGFSRTDATLIATAISEIAVAMSVASVRENPSCVASARPSARAGTRSESEPIGTRISSPILGVPLHSPIEHRERLVEVERGMERLEVQVELHH